MSDRSLQEASRSISSAVSSTQRNICIQSAFAQVVVTVAKNPDVPPAAAGNSMEVVSNSEGAVWPGDKDQAAVILLRFLNGIL